MSVGILKYFTLKHMSSLPSPDDPLSKVVPSEGISLANKEVLEAEDNCLVPSGNASGSSHSHGRHEHFTIDKKIEIGKKAAEIGVASFPLSFSQNSILLMKGVK